MKLGTRHRSTMGSVRAHVRTVLLVETCCVWRVSQASEKGKLGSRAFHT